MRPRRCLSAFLVITAACAGPDVAGPDPVRSASRDQLAPPGVAARSITVLTRNIYPGADLDALLEPGVDFGQAALEAWATVQFTSFPSRARALAAEIDELRPHAVGLQEAVTFTVLAPDFTVLGQQSHLQILLDELAALGLDYDVAVFTPNTDFTAPVGDLANPAFYVNFLDAEAILVRGDVPWSDAAADIYAAHVPLPFGIDILQVWQTVDITVAGQTVRFANTHLEGQTFAQVQEAQTAELIGVLAPSPWPVILVGDLNSAANRSAPEDRKTASYGMLLEAGFVDLWTHSGPADKGLTCCHDPDLANVAPAFDQRLDLVLMRNATRGTGFVGGTTLDIVGEEIGDRFDTGLGYALWPSDHAGVAAAVWLPPGR